MHMQDDDAESDKGSVKPPEIYTLAIVAAEVGEKQPITLQGLIDGQGIGLYCREALSTVIFLRWTYKLYWNGFLT